MRPTSGSRPRHPATSPFVRPTVVPPSTADFHVGDRVTSDEHGLGRVTGVTEDYIIVDFGDGITKSLSAGTKGLSRL